MSEKQKKEGIRVFHSIGQWVKTSSFKCVLMLIAAYFILLAMFFSVITPVRYDLNIGSVAHETIKAPKDVVDEVTTQERKNAVAALVAPKTQYQNGIKEEVKTSLKSAFNELRTIQQYGITLQEEGKSRSAYSEDEIDYAFGLLNDLSLSRNQVITLLGTSTEDFEEMVSKVTIAVDNAMNYTIVEGEEKQSVQTILQAVGYTVDISLIQNILPYILNYCIKPNMVIDQEATEEARKKAMEEVENTVYLQGQYIVREGDRITESQMQMLDSLGLLKQNSYDYSVYRGASIAVLLSMFILIISLRLLRKELLSDIRRMAVILMIVVLGVGFAALAHLLPSLYIMPLATGAILATVLIGYRAGISVAVTLTLLFSALTSGNNNSTFYDVVLLSSMTLAEGFFVIWFLKGRPQRLRVLLAGLICSMISCVMILCVKWLTAAENLNIISTGVWAIGGGLLSGGLALALQPVFEGLFRLDTMSRLLELTNPSQPLMRRLMIEAPGTYHHSIIVANLAEAAAGEIGANQYLARAGAYYHDVGKLKRPAYFKENQNGENPHEKTDPYVSAAILTSHTMDGMLLAQKEHLPPEIQNIILQHHGVTPVMYFYHKALQLSNGSHVDIDDFRYAGPKPQTKEAAVVMLADTIEAAVRSMKDPTPKAIDQFIERLVRGKLEDGQLSECPLSLRDLDDICKAFSGILRGVYHERIEYPTVRRTAGQAVADAGKNTAEQTESPTTAETNARKNDIKGPERPAENEDQSVRPENSPESDSMPNTSMPEITEGKEDEA